MGCNSKEIFANLKIAKDHSFEKYLNQYNVIFINMVDFWSETKNVTKMLALLQNRIIQELQETFSNTIAIPKTSFTEIFKQIYQAEKKGFVIIIDEWDCIFRENAKYVGFTETEVEVLCQQYSMDLQETKRWYDGYSFRKEAHVYSPKSVVDAMFCEEFDNYWTQTETYEALKIYIDMNYDGLRDAIIEMLGGVRCKINAQRFQNDMTTFSSKDDVLTLLIHLGYLAYDIDRQEAFIPNEEVRNEFLNAMEGNEWREVITAVEKSQHLLEAILNNDAKTVADGVDMVHNENISILQYNNENALSCVISLAFYTAREKYLLIRELPTGKGFADIVLLPRPKYLNEPAMILELKWDKSVDTAINQIKEKQYCKSLENYIGKIMLVGISYDKKNKIHECVIEEVEK